MDGDIDAVITWVDGSDPTHLEKRLAALRSNGTPESWSIPAGKADSRFSSSGELQYCISAIRRYAPWIRTIHIVTDSQCPPFLGQAASKQMCINIVDHAELFRGFEDRLPVFNSRSIETVLHRIDGLTDRFLYFNDDVFLLAPCSEEDFFKDGKVVLRGRKMPLKHPGRFRLFASSVANHIGYRVFGINRSMPVLAQQVAARVAGLDRWFIQLDHVPHPMIKSTLNEFFAAHPGIMERNMSFKFRSMEQFVAAPLAAFLEVVADNYVHSTDSDHVLICFNRDNRRKIKRKLAIVRKEGIKILCLQAFDQAPKDIQRDVEGLLTAKIGPGISKAI